MMSAPSTMKYHIIRPILHTLKAAPRSEWLGTVQKSREGRSLVALNQACWYFLIIIVWIGVDQIGVGQGLCMSLASCLQPLEIGGASPICRGAIIKIAHALLLVAAIHLPGSAHERSARR